MRIRIVSDGYGRSTHVMAVSEDGEHEVPIRGVQAVEWDLPHPRGRATAKLTVSADVDAVAELDQWRPAPRDPTIEGEWVPFWPAFVLCLVVVAFVAAVLIERAL